MNPKHRHLFILMIGILFAGPAVSQTVSTLVTGPAAFDDALSLDAQGNLYASYYFGGVVSKISPDGTVTQFASGLLNPNGSTIGTDGNLYLAEAMGSRIWKFEPDGTASVFKLGLTNPSGVVFDLDGNLLVAQYQLSRITSIKPDGTTSVLMSGNGLNGPVGLQMDAEGNLYVGNFTDGRIFKRAPDGTVTQLADLPGWLGFMTLAGDALYATGFQVHRIYKVALDGSGATVFAGTGSPGNADGDIATASFNSPNGITASPDGNTLYITDYDSRSIRMISNISGVSAVAPDDLPGQSIHLQLHPNPFNPTTTIEYELAAAAYVSLKIFDARGREVANLVAEAQSTGPHHINFSGEGLPSGVYFSRLETEGEFITKKMVLAK